MSRIGKKIIQIPSGVTVTPEATSVGVKGPKGELTIALHPVVRVEVAGAELKVLVADPTDVKQRALWGLFRSLIQNAVQGVTEGYVRQLEVNGVGFRVAQSGKKLTFEVGFSHPVVFEVPAGVEVVVEKNMITLRGIDKQLVSEAAAQIRRIKEPEPYKGKGIKYVEEVIRRKAGKAVKAAGG